MPEHFIIEADGRVLRRTWDDYVVRVDDDLANALCKDRTNKLARFTLIEGNSVGLCLGATHVSATVHLRKLHLRCPWINNPDGTISPCFNIREPVLEIDWTKPGDMDLVIMIRFSHGLDSAQRPRRLTLERVYMWAICTTDKKTYRLPLANTYAGGEICTGLNDVPAYDHLVDGLTHMFGVMKNSTWRADLLPNQDHTRLLFRFKPVGAGFEQVNPAVHWTTLCVSAGNAMLSEVA